MHYQRWCRTGNAGPAAPLRIVADDRARFWSYVEKTPTCWLWTGPTAREKPGAAPYGALRIGGVGGPNLRAHRLIYEWTVGPIPTGHHLHHTCENTLCVNPAHTEPVSPAAHLRLTNPHAARNAAMAARTTCKRGHPKALYGRHTGRQWICRECRRLKANGSIPKRGH